MDELKKFAPHFIGILGIFSGIMGLVFAGILLAVDEGNVAGMVALISVVTMVFVPLVTWLFHTRPWKKMIEARKKAAQEAKNAPPKPKSPPKFWTAILGGIMLFIGIVGSLEIFSAIRPAFELQLALYLTLSSGIGLYGVYLLLDWLNDWFEYINDTIQNTNQGVGWIANQLEDDKQQQPPNDNN